MKASNATSARATGPRRPTDQSSAPLTPTSADGFGLTGPSNPPDPAYHAYRRDLADTRLVDQVIASHYAEALERVIITAAVLRSEASGDSEALLELQPGEAFAMLDNSRGWAWGYAGTERRVGYVPSGAVGTA